MNPATTEILKRVSCGLKSVDANWRRMPVRFVLSRRGSTTFDKEPRSEQFVAKNTAYPADTPRMSPNGIR
jgi:hypothetical protein